MVGRLGLRGRLFLSVLVLVGVFAATSGWWLSRQLRRELVADVEAHLGAQARTLARVVPAGADRARVARAAADFAHTTGARVTVIARDGVVLADSDVEDVGAMDNHRTRPEIARALAEGHGTSIRFSKTVRQQMLYVAVPWPEEHPIGVVRLARPLTEVEARVGRISRALLLAGGVGLGLTLLLAAALAERFTRDVRALTARARDLARGSALPIHGDEVASISGSIDRLAAELRQAMDEVAEERNRLQAVLAGMGDAVIAVDRHGRVELTNPAARALLGLDEGVVGRTLVEAVGSPELAAVVAGVIASGQADTADLRWTRGGSGRDLDLRVTVTPQVGAGAVAVVHDMTELLRLEAVRRDFVANVSHELRTPVAVIQSSAEALVAGAVEDPEHGPGFARAIHRHAERLGSLIADLLELARIERGGMALELGPVALDGVVDEALGSIRDRAADRRQALEVRIPAGLEVRADRVALRQIVANLADNAVKYTPEGGRITLRARAVPGGVELAVEDDGPGIPDTHHDRIFERFYRVDPGRSRQMGGTGLGLAIVRHLVDIQGARIRVEHNQPRGARFVLTLERA